jgi:hypothetical protein
VAKARISKYIYLAVISVIITPVLFVSFVTFINTIPVYAAAEAAKWTRLSIPTEGEAGGWTLAENSDIRCLTMAADGTMYAYGAGLTYTLLKSTDGGLKWASIGQVRDEIKCIAASTYDPAFLYYATATNVYRSADAGQSFTQLPAPGGAGTGNIEITSLAAGWLNGSIIAAGTRDTDIGEYGGVYVFDEAEILPSWADTGLGGYDAYAVTFAPGYSSYQQIAVVVTDETNSWVFSKNGNQDWNASLGAAKLNRNNSSVPAPVATAESATLAFPEGYIPDTSSPECFFYAGINSGTSAGDVFKITCIDAPEESLADDLDIRGGNAPDTDVTSLAAATVQAADGSGPSLVLLAGAADNALTFTSTDGGITWAKTHKAPTGGGEVLVLSPHDYITSGVVYAATSGGSSALSTSRDNGNTWNQVSLIDGTIENIVDIAASPDYTQDRTLFFLTFGSSPGSDSLWRSTADGLAWERVLSGANAGVDTLRHIGLPPEYGADCQTIFISGESGSHPVIWFSDDNGQTYRSRISRNPNDSATLAVDAWAIENKTTLYIGYYDGTQSSVYKTVNGGFSFTGGAPAGSSPLYSLALSPGFPNDQTLIAGSSTGTVYLSRDGGASFTALPSETDAAPLDGCIDAAFDPAFLGNGLIYISNNTAGAGFYRFNTGEDNTWESISNGLPVDAMINHLTVTGEGVLYGINSNSGGEMERCLAPGHSEPVFDSVDRGLSAGTTLSCLCAEGGYIWAADTTNCRLMAYHDTLTVPVIQSAPENGISGVGRLDDNEVMDITIDWETLDGATSYEWQCANNRDFSPIPNGLEGTVTGSSVRLPALEPAAVYYWRARAKTPALSPWSEVWSFTTGLGTQVIELQPESPAAGATGAPLKPVFQWTAVIGASAYELLVSADADFEHPVIIKENTYALPSNVWECDVSLDYGTTYYWKVRAVTASTHSVWSATGIFTTLPIPLEEDYTNETPQIRLLDNPNPVTTLAPELITSPQSSATTQPSLPTSASPAVTTTIITTVALPAPEIPQWVIYFIGGLLATVILALFVILAAVLKTKRF